MPSRRAKLTTSTPSHLDQTLSGTGPPESVKLSPSRNKLPLVSLGVQDEFEHPVGVVVVDLRVGNRMRDLIEAPAPCAYHELPDAILGIRPPLHPGGKTLVIVVVSVEHHIHASGVEDLPKTLHPFLAGTYSPEVKSG